MRIRVAWLPYLVSCEEEPGPSLFLDSRLRRSATFMSAAPLISCTYHGQG